MKIIKAYKRRSYGGGPFHIDILYPGAALNTNDTGFLTIGRIDHAFFRPPGVVPMHPHRDDEILSYMRSGAQIHKDTKGHTEHLNASRLMMMNAGAGIEHEEIAKEAVEMLQIFMRPSENGLAPAVQFHQFNHVHSIDQWRLVAGNSTAAPLQLRTQTNIYDIRLSAGSKIDIPFSEPEVVNFLYVFNGAINIGDSELGKGDSVVLDNQKPGIIAAKESDLLLFQILKGATYSDTGMFSGNQF